jgi:hypothetical protein
MRKCIASAVRPEFTFFNSFFVTFSTVARFNRVTFFLIKTLKVQEET